MRPAIAVLGTTVLGAASGISPAVATGDPNPPGAMICHLTEAGTYEPFFVSVHGMIHDLNGHGSHAGDIIPFPGFGGNPAGQNMTPENVAILNNGCIGAIVATTGPVVSVPPAAPMQVQVPATTTYNPGYNVDGGAKTQTERPRSPNATDIWLIGACALLAASAIATFWRTTNRAKKAA